MNPQAPALALSFGVFAFVFVSLPLCPLSKGRAPCPCALCPKGEPLCLSVYLVEPILRHSFLSPLLFLSAIVPLLSLACASSNAIVALASFERAPSLSASSSFLPSWALSPLQKLQNSLLNSFFVLLTVPKDVQGESIAKQACEQRGKG